MREKPRRFIAWSVALLAVAPFQVSAQVPSLDAMDLVLKSVPDGPVAKVNGVNVRKIDFIRLYESELRRVAEISKDGKVPDGARIQLALWGIANLIQDELLHQEALKRKYAIPNESLDRSWQAQIERMRRGDDSLDEKLLLARIGYASRSEVLRELERALLIEQTRAAIVRESGLEVSDEDVTAAYETEKKRFSRPDLIHLRQVFFRASKSSGPKVLQLKRDARRRADEALARLSAGQSFAGVARAVSESPDRDSGGEIGPLPLGQVPPFLVEAAIRLAPGDVSEVIESRHGFHIVQLIELVPGQSPSLEDVWALLKDRLLAKRGEKVVREYCDVLIENEADVRVYLELDKTLATNPDYAELRLK